MANWKFALGVTVAALLGATVAFSSTRLRGSEPPPGASHLDAGSVASPPGRAYTAEELGEIYKAEFAAEVRDPAWAEGAERQYRPVLEAQLPGTSRLVSFECRARFCRMEVVHESVSSSNEFLMRLFGLARHDASPGLSLSKATGGFRAAPPTPTPDGKLDYQVFIAKPGVSTALAASDAPPG